MRQSVNRRIKIMSNQNERSQSQISTPKIMALILDSPNRLAEFADFCKSESTQAILAASTNDPINDTEEELTSKKIGSVMDKYIKSFKRTPEWFTQSTPPAFTQKLQIATPNLNPVTYQQLIKDKKFTEAQEKDYAYARQLSLQLAERLRKEYGIANLLTPKPAGF
jgi:hypothetical protein